MNDTTTYRVAIIGTGPRHGQNDSKGWGMAHSHARGYKSADNCEIVALCDIIAERADAYNAEYADNNAQIFTDYRELLAEVRPDIVSVCTWPHLHAPMVVAAAEAGVRAIHCEKPMAPTWAEARQMADACAQSGTQLSFNHQRRHGGTFQEAHRRLNDGAIGDLLRMEAACPNLHDWGTHWINMMQFYNGETAAAWVIGQADMTDPHDVYGLAHESHGLAHIGYENGVTSALFTGRASEKNLGAAIRLHGTHGVMSLHNDAPHLRIVGTNGKTSEELTLDGLHGTNAVEMAVGDAVTALASGRKPLLDVANALATSEIIFATYESARRRARIELPLQAHDDIIQNLVAQSAVAGGEDSSVRTRP